MDNQIGKNEKMYHWLYGPMTVTKVEQDEFSLGVDDPQRVTREYRDWAISGPDKRFFLTSLNYSIHRVAVEITSDSGKNNFQEKLPIYVKELHPGIKEIVQSELKELQEIVQFLEKMEEDVKKLEAYRTELERLKNELEKIKEDETSFTDHEKYAKALTSKDSHISKVEASILSIETENEMKDYLPKLDTFINKYNILDRSNLVQEVKEKIQKCKNFIG